MNEQPITIQVLSDTNLQDGSGRLSFVDDVPHDASASTQFKMPLWVVEHAEVIDTTELQETARLAGRDVLVCSFHRHTVASIGPCRVFVGSIAAVAAASGFTIHCDADILRASRELRGRLAAKTVAVLEDRYLHVVDGQRATTSAVADASIADILLRLSGLDAQACVTHAA